GHYKSVAPRNYSDFNRDVELYYESLRGDITTMDWMVSDLAQRNVAFDPDLWNAFRNELEEQIGYEVERPRLEWASEHLAEDSGPLLAATDAVHAELRRQSDASRRSLWFSSIALGLATLALAFAVAWLFRERVLKRIAETSRSVRRMADGEFTHGGTQSADDELGQLESDVGFLARRTYELVNVLDTLNGANTLHEAIDRLPTRLKRQFGVAWLGLVELHDGRVRLRTSQPSREMPGLEPPGSGWLFQGSLLADARASGRAVFARLRNGDGELGLDDALLVQLREAGLVSVALLPVRDGVQITAGVLLASRSPDAFNGWRRRWLENVGHLIAQGLYKSIHTERLGISMVRGLAELAEKRDSTTGQHLERMQRYAGHIARRLVALGHVDEQRSPHFAEQVETFAPLHDIGKVGISDTILLKPGALTQSEISEMRRHPQIGAEVLMAAGARLGAQGEKLLAHATDIALYHHEKYDGSGYPRGLKGEAIPL
ncbi:MAG: HD domain-containing phosphohydrolase, partial [Wenzhouxiangellaceae bacterium]